MNTRKLLMRYLTIGISTYDAKKNLSSIQLFLNITLGCISLVIIRLKSALTLKWLL